MAKSWCKVASNLDSHPKIIKAGRLGREVFLFALRLNAEPDNPIPGQLPVDRFEPWFIARTLQMTEEEAETGVTLAVTHGLLTLGGQAYLIRGFDEEWGKGPTPSRDRTAKWRENKRTRSGVTDGDDGDGSETSHRHGDDGDALEEKRREEIKEDRALATVLILKVIANNPRSTIAKLAASKKTETIERWADHVRKMREIDGHSPAEIKAVIDWCTKDEFWKTNIQSTETLRKQWNQLTAKMGRGTSSNFTKPTKYSQPTLTFSIGDVEVER